MRKQIIPAVIILALGMGLGLAILLSGPEINSRSPESVAPLVKVLTVQPQRVQMSIITHGSVAPRTESMLIPEVSGSITKVSEAMVSGGFFKQGDLLVSIDDNDYRQNLTQAKAGLMRAESDLANARRSHQRQTNLAENNSTSAVQKDDALNRLSMAEATMSESRAKLLRAERDIERTQLRAPFDGRVRFENVDVGQFVNRGTTMATLYATDYAEVKLPIVDSELAFLNLGLLSDVRSATPLRVILRADFAGKPRQWQAQLVRSEGELDAKTRMINLVARVDAPYQASANKPPLAVGLFVEAEIFGIEVDQVTVLPRAALRDDSQVIIVDKDNRLRFVDVTVLRIADDQVYISAGLSAGQKVSIANMSSPIDGMLVRTVASDGAATDKPSAGDAS